MHCFADTTDFGSLDRRAFTFTHTLLGHPTLSLENLGRVLPALPKDQVFYSSGQLQKTDDFDRAHVDKKNGLSLEETVEKLRTTQSYIMVRAPEVEPSFKDLHRQLMDDVGQVMQRCGVGRVPLESMLYLFIASPNALTPFHIDRYTTFLLQFRGRKQVAVYPCWDERVVTAAEQDAFMAYSGERPSYRPDAEPLASVFDFKPGEAVHIPFMAGHWVKNGADDVSISMSIIFTTELSQALGKAMRLNHRLRRLGLSPKAVGQGGLRDKSKALVQRAAGRLARLVRPGAAAGG